MKTIAFLLLFSLPVLAQDGIVYTYSQTTTLDSSDTEVFFLGFKGGYSFGSDDGLSTSAITPKNGVSVIDELLISGYIDSLKSSTAKDSIFGYVQGLDVDGYVITDTLFYDFTNNDTTTAIQYLNSITPFNQTGAFTQGTSAPNFWIDLTGLLKNYHGLKFTIGHTGIGGTNDSLSVKQNIAIGRTDK